MLDKQRLDGPTVSEWAAEALSPETAETIRRGMTVHDDGSATLAVEAPAAVLAEAARFFARLGIAVEPAPALIPVEGFRDHLDAVVEWVVHHRQPVEIDLGGELVHLAAGPAMSALSAGGSSDDTPSRVVVRPLPLPTHNGIYS